MGGEHFEIAADSIELAGNKLDFDIPAKPIHLAIAKLFAVPFRLPEKGITGEGGAIVVGEAGHGLAGFVDNLNADSAIGAVNVDFKGFACGAEPFCSYPCGAGDGFKIHESV